MWGKRYKDNLRFWSCSQGEGLGVSDLGGLILASHIQLVMVCSQSDSMTTSA
jgi:hypothetical protein